MNLEEDERWMEEAIAEAKRAATEGEVPVGCVIVQNGTIVGRGRNRREASQDPTTHAEIIAVQEAAAAIGSWRLLATTLYVTLEPCPMCAGALVNARVPRVVWGCDDPKAGATRTLYAIGSDPRLNHQFDAIGGVLDDDCASLLTEFFGAIRAKGKSRDNR